MSKVGGLKLKNASLSHFHPILDMMSKGTITLLTAASLKGFMFKLDVDETDSQYFDLGSGGRFNYPVVSFILKFTITGINDARLPNYGTVKKSCESNQSFFDEALLQQTIWETNILGGKQAICPSVANLALFENATAIQLLNWMRTMALPGDAGFVVNYLLTQLRRANYGIGVITMPTIQSSSTLWTFTQANPAKKDDAKVSVVIQIILLFLQNVIHLDLHMSNSLVFMRNESIHTRIIDFGRATTFDDGSPLNTDKKELLERMFALPARSKRKAVDLESGENIIRRILTVIADTEFEISQRTYNYDDKTRYQMKWIERDFIRPGRDDLLLKVFNGVVKAYTPKGTLSGATIKSYKKQGVLISLEDMRQFIQPPDIMSGYDTASSSPSHSMTASYSASSPSPNTSPTVVRQLFSQSQSQIPTRPHAPSPIDSESFDLHGISGIDSFDASTRPLPQAAAQPFSTIQPGSSDLHEFSNFGGIFSAGRRTRRKRRKQKTRHR